MSSLNTSFWHKGQRDLIVNQPLGKLGFSMNASEQTSWSAIPVMIAGNIYTLTDDAAGADTVIVPVEPNPRDFDLTTFIAELSSTLANIAAILLIVDNQTD